MKYESLGQLLKDAAHTHPERPALFFEWGGAAVSVSYRELCERVYESARRLTAEKCSCVGFYAAASCEWVCEMLASVLAGKRTVLLDASQPPETTRQLVAATSVDKLFCGDSRDESELAPYMSAPQACNNDVEGDLLFFTSGTTASNKAVVLTSRALCSSAWNGQQMLPCGTSDVILSMLPLNHVFGFVCSLLWPLSQGAAVAIGRGMRSYTTDPSFFKPTILPAVPSLIRYLLAAGALNEELTTVLVGASPCDEDTLAAIRQKGIDVRFGYGLTETASGLAISLAHKDPFAMALCPDTELRLAEDGEIFVRTTCMMQGYFNDEAATAAVLKDGELATGDIGALDENGCLHITGRKNDVLILPNGTKIFCAEWEAALSSLLGCEVAVTLEGRRVTLVAASADGERDALWGKVELFNATQPIDRRIANLVTRSEPLPRTATGKLKRWAV